MTLPQLTHLQFLVVNALLRSAATGRTLRARLAEAGVRQSGPAFYQMMAVLEDGGLVSGRYQQEVVDGQIIRQRQYKLLAGGKRAWQVSRDFYVRALGARPAEPAHGS